MKAGLAAAVEALLALRDAGLLPAGSILLTAHDLHEAPWGDGRQLDRLIARRLSSATPSCSPSRSATTCRSSAGARPAGRSRSAARARRSTRSCGPADEPERHRRRRRAGRAARRASTRDSPQAADPIAGRASVFVGQIHGGEIYNQYPQECRLEGTRRWLPGTDRRRGRARVPRRSLDESAARPGATVDDRVSARPRRLLPRPGDPLVAAFQARLRGDRGPAARRSARSRSSTTATASGRWAGVPAITHGPAPAGSTRSRSGSTIDDLVRVALALRPDGHRATAPGG